MNLIMIKKHGIIINYINNFIKKYIVDWDPEKKKIRDKFPYDYLPAPKKTSMENDLKLYNLLFHYNHYRKKWACFSRDEKREYFNGETNNVGIGGTVEKAYEDYKNQDEY